MVSSIIVAAGKGVRMDHTAPKQYMDLAGRPLLAHCLQAFKACNEVENIFLVIQKKDFDYCKKEIISPLDLEDKVNLVAGGIHRQDSVFKGLRTLDEETNMVVIHDGVRPFIRADEISACIRGAVKFGACIVGIPASDTLKHVGKSDIIEKTLSREVVWFAQTPQAFQYDLILEAHETARKQGFKGTDDAILVERLGTDVKIISGSKRNIKITTREDLILAEAIYHADLRI